MVREISGQRPERGEPVESRVLKKSQSEREHLHRSVEFLSESNALVGITKIDYSKKEFQDSKAGYFGALSEAIQFGKEKRDLTVVDVCHWQTMILQELKDQGIHTTNHFGKLQEASAPDFGNLLKELNHSLEGLSPFPDEVEVVTILGDFYQNFFELNPPPFSEGSGRVSRLIINYIASRVGIPIIVFHATESDFQKAASSHLSMRCKMAPKIQEAVYGDQGEIYHKVKDFGLSAQYKNPQNSDETIVEWHPLISAIEKWKQGIE